MFSTSITRNIIIALLFFIPAGTATAQTISGPTCVVPGVSNQYTVSGISGPGLKSWCISNGLIQPNNTSCLSTSQTTITVKFNSGVTSGEVTVTAPGGSAELSVTISAPFDAGSINSGSLSQTINFNGVPQTIQCSPASGGCPGGVISYIWQSSNDQVNWTGTGATGQNYSPGNLSQTTYFRRFAASGSGSGYSDIAVVNVYPQLIAGAVIPASQPTINYNSTASQLSLSGVSGGSGVYSYQWKQSTDGVNYTNIGATGTSYTPVNVTAQRYYRVAVTSNGVTVFSAAAVVNVYPQLLPGTISPSSQTILYNSAASSLSISGTSGGNVVYSYQWESSSNNTTFTPISGANSTSFSPGVLLASGYYRVAVTSNGSTAYTTSAYIDVRPLLSSGTISGSTNPVSYYGSPGQITGSQPTGGICGSYLYQWEISFDGTNFDVIPGANAMNYTPVNLTRTCVFRRKVTCGTESGYSNLFTVTVKAALNPGMICISSFTIPAHTTPGQLTTSPATGGNCSSYNYQWEESYDNISFSAIPGAQSEHYIPDNLDNRLYYRRKVTCGTDVAYTSVCVINIASLISSDMNYIRTRDLLKSGITDKAVADALVDELDVKQVTRYFEGLGNLTQTVSKRESPAGKDMVLLNGYDRAGREAVSFLPYVSDSEDGEYKVGSIVAQREFNSGHFQGENYYYSQVQFEPSPLNRVTDSYAPGVNWLGAGKGAQFWYWFNTPVDDVKIWAVTYPSDSGTEWGSYSKAGEYNPGELYKNLTIDEHGNQVIEFKDKKGMVILKKVQLTASPDSGSGRGYTGWLCTYYIYDDLSRLRAVIQPRGVELLVENNWDITALSNDILDEQCFRYEYDHRDRMTMKKVPGAGELHMVYDKRDRLLMTQDGNLRAEGKWLVTEYDELNRPYRTGKLTDGNNRAWHQDQAKNSTNYPNTSSNYEVLTQTYYDNYDWASGAGLPATIDVTYAGNSAYFITSYNSSPLYAQPLTAIYATRGLITGTKTKVLGTTDQYLYSVSFYDDRGRVIQVQSINVTGGRDIVTTQYDFSGKVLRMLMQHQKNAANSQSHIVLTKMNYDHAGRLTSVSKAVDNTTERIIAAHTYNELGQLNDKSLGNNLATLTNDYNIRGWLLGVNRNYLADNGTGSYFGFELAYDKTGSEANRNFNTAQYNGNISGMLWKSMGDGIQRKYDFNYDAANRLMRADFEQHNTDGSWNNSTVNFSMKMGNGTNPDSAYDANGNIRSMMQYGLKLNTSPLIDQMQYEYYPNSNKLKRVVDAANDNNSKLGDFKYDPMAKGDTDYGYDLNGNLITDLNKKLNGSLGIDNNPTAGTGAIKYNHLNLPQQISVVGKGQITYTFDASGSKLSKTVFDSLKNTTTTTLYVGGFEYKNDSLQQIAHEEGRIRYAKKYFVNGDSAYNYFYDYFIKDHLGNVRMVLTEQKDTAGYVASMEIGNSNAIRNKESLLFNNVQSTEFPTGSVPGGYPTNNQLTTPNEYVSRLNGSDKRVGPSIVLKVMAGDIVDVGVQYYYQAASNSTPNTNIVNDILASLAGGIISVAGETKGTLGELGNTSTSPLLGILNIFRSQNNPEVSQKPKAYLNWILLDEQFRYQDNPQSGALAVGNSSSDVRHLAPGSINITKNGYLYIYVSNESENWNVYFDNLSVRHYSGPILEETHYYPWGLTMAGISSRASKPNYFDNKYKFNKGSELQSEEFSDGSGLELYATRFRSLDPQLGRWWQIDPEPKDAESPYVSMGNNPIYYNDPLGNDTLPSGKYIWEEGALEELEWMAAEDPNATWSPSFGERVYMLAQWFGVALPTGKLATAIKVEQTTQKTAQADKVVGPAEKAVRAANATRNKTNIIRTTENVLPKKESLSGHGGGKNAQHANQKARAAAEKRYNEAKQKYNDLKSKPNKTKEDNEALQKAERAMKHEKQKMDNTGENHSQKAKGSN